MDHAAQARVPGRWGFCCLAVRPCSRACKRARTCCSRSSGNARCRLVVMGRSALASTTQHGLTWRGDQCDDDELFEGIAVLESLMLCSISSPWRLTVRNSCSTCPRWRLPPDHRQGLRDGFDIMSGQQPPVDRFFAGRWIELANLDGEKLDLSAGARGSEQFFGPTDADPPEPHGQACLARLTLARSRRQIGAQKRCRSRKMPSWRREQAAAAVDGAVPTGTGQQMSATVRQASPFFHKCPPRGRR